MSGPLYKLSLADNKEQLRGELAAWSRFFNDAIHQLEGVPDQRLLRDDLRALAGHLECALLYTKPPERPKEKTDVAR